MRAESYGVTHWKTTPLSPERLTLQASYAGDSNPFNLTEKKKLIALAKKLPLIMAQLYIIRDWTT